MSPTVIAIIGLLCFPVSIGLFFAYLHHKKEVEKFSEVKSVKIADLPNVAREMEKLSGTKAKRQGLVKLSGTIVANPPLISELFQEPCIYYNSEVDLEYDEVTYYRDTLDETGVVISSERLSHPPYQGTYGDPYREQYGDPYRRTGGSSYGESGGGGGSYGESSIGSSYENYGGGQRTRIRTETDRHKENIYRNSRRINFYLQDETGQVLIDVDEAKIDNPESRDRYVSGIPHDGNLRFGNFTKSVGQYLHDQDKNARGFHVEEEFFSTKEKTYITGQLRMENGTPVIKKVKSTLDVPFLISHKSHSESLKEMKENMTYSLYGACGCLIAGMVTVILLLTRVLRF
jgi:hypothetical protein